MLKYKTLASLTEWRKDETFYTYTYRGMPCTARDDGYWLVWLDGGYMSAVSASKSHRTRNEYGRNLFEAKVKCLQAVDEKLGAEIADQEQ